MGRDIGVTVTLREEHLAVFDYGHYSTGDVSGVERVWHEAIEPCFEIDLVQGMGQWRPRVAGFGMTSAAVAPADNSRSPMR